MEENPGSAKRGGMAGPETFAKCVVWYVVALLLVPLPYILFGQRELIPWCMIGLPSLPVLVFFMHAGPDPNAIIVIGYLVQIALAAKAASAGNVAVRRTCYLVFRCLLVLDVLVAWCGPILFLSIMRPGE